MPTLKVWKPLPKQRKRPFRIVALTEARLAKMFRDNLKQLDDRIAQNKAMREKSKYRDEAKKIEPIRLIEDDGTTLIREGIHALTKNGNCHNPTVFLNGGRACDNCALYPWCMSPVKRLKHKESQPEDKNRAYFRALEIAEMEKAERQTRKTIRIKRLRIKLT